MHRSMQSHASFASFSCDSEGGASKQGLGVVYSLSERRAITHGILFPVTTMVCAENGTADAHKSGLSNAKRGTESRDWHNFSSIAAAARLASKAVKNDSLSIPKSVSREENLAMDQNSSTSHSGVEEPLLHGGKTSGGDQEMTKDRSFQRENHDLNLFFVPSLT